MTVSGCSTTPKSWVTQERADYIEMVPEIQKQYLGKTTKQVCSGTVGTSMATTSTVHHKDSITVTHGSMDTGTQATGCKYVQEDNFLEKEAIVPTTRYEDYVVSHRAHTASISGTFEFEFEGRAETHPFRFDGYAEDAQWSSKHAGSATFRRNTEAGAKSHAYSKLQQEVAAKAVRLVARRGSAFQGTALGLGHAAPPLDVEHLYFLAFELGSGGGRVSAGFADSLATHYGLTEASILAALNGDPLPRTDLARDARVRLPELPVAELEEEKSWDRLDEFKSRKTRTSRLFTAVIGPSQVRRAPDDGGNLTGGQFAFGITILPPWDSDSVFSMGGGYRLNVGLDQTLTAYLDTDFMFLAGLQLGGLSLAPLVGLGFNFTSNSADGPEGNELHLPGSAYAQYGARIAWSFEAPALTLELIYSKAYRASDVLPAENRLDFRAGLVFPGGLPLGLTVRYAEHLEERDSPLKLFDAEHRLAQRMWLLAGIGF